MLFLKKVELNVFLEKNVKRNRFFIKKSLSLTFFELSAAGQFLHLEFCQETNHIFKILSSLFYDFPEINTFKFFFQKLRNPDDHWVVAIKLLPSKG